jgi:hypothetical protein
MPIRNEFYKIEDRELFMAYRNQLAIEKEAKLAQIPKHIGPDHSVCEARGNW